MKKILGLVTAVVLAFSATGATAQEKALKVGDTVPATLSFTDHTGTPHTFGDYRGKTVVLEWTNPGCPFVKKHYDGGNMQKLQADATAKGVTWLAVNSAAEGKQGYASQKDAAQAMAKMGFKGTAWVLDPTGALGKTFGAETTPHMFVIDTDGKLAYAGAIDSIPSFSQEDIAKADNYVTQALAALAAGKPVATPSTRSYGCSVKY